jgi:type II secretory pathway pseudopilin PulG
MRAHAEAQAFTKVDLLFVLAILVVLAAIFSPAFFKSKARSSRSSCANNLKETYLAFLTWGVDNHDLLPMQVPVANGGTKELVEAGKAFPHFQVMSNELSTPRVLTCPQDTTRYGATNFTSDLNDDKISYFVGVDSISGNPSCWLAGDRNLTNHFTRGSALLTLTSNMDLGWSKEIHSWKGNIAFGNGTVEQVLNGSVRQVLQSMGSTSNRLAVP